jgi:hypothetical protein
MSEERPDRTRELELELDLASLRSHERHMRHIYGLRWGGLALSALTILAGAVMTFLGLQGSFNWAVEVPLSITAKLTNASPGIIFATAGLLLGFITILQKPVNYETTDSGNSITVDLSKPRRRWSDRSG